MRIQTPQSALLSNHEVYHHIKSESAHYLAKENAKIKPLSNVREILKDGLRYFEGDPNALPSSSSSSEKTWINPVKHISDTHPNRPMTLYKGPHSLLRALAPKYRLNKAEYLQLYNVRPRSRVTLDLIVEEAPTRFTDEEMDDILDTVMRVFDEEEENIHAGAEDEEMERLPDEMLGVVKKKKKPKRKA